MFGAKVGARVGGGVGALVGGLVGARVGGPQPLLCTSDEATSSTRYMSPFRRLERTLILVLISPLTSPRVTSVVRAAIMRERIIHLEEYIA